MLTSLDAPHLQKWTRGVYFPLLLLVVVYQFIFFYPTMDWSSRETSIAQDVELKPAQTRQNVVAASTNNLRTHSEFATRGPVVDILSIGSQRRPDYLQAQAETFGAHPVIRHFRTATEVNDTEQDCASNLTDFQITKISNYCKDMNRFADAPDSEYSFLKMRADKYFGPETLLDKPNPAGWLCAQKRPMDGMYELISSYPKNDFPDYLIVMDDDTWVNMDVFLRTLQSNFTIDRPLLVAGCRISSRRGERHFKFPYGGWGYTFTKSLLEAMTKPRHCPPEHADDSEFCERLALNNAGEREVFLDGMSALELMYQYAHHQRMTDIDNWTRAGFCMYSE